MGQNEARFKQKIIQISTMLTRIKWITQNGIKFEVIFAELFEVNVCPPKNCISQ
jgi:hypothetical protein